MDWLEDNLAGRAIWASSSTHLGRIPIDFYGFVGAWSVKRRIVDHQAGAAYAFAGSAIVTGTSFRETGHFQTADATLAAARDYRLEMSGAAILVLRPDGSPFVSLAPAGRQAVRHACGADLYVGRLLVRSEHVWAETWRVRGPRKHYSSLSLYRRIHEPGPEAIIPREPEREARFRQTGAQSRK